MSTDCVVSDMQMQPWICLLTKDHAFGYIALCAQRALVWPCIWALIGIRRMLMPCGGARLISVIARWCLTCSSEICEGSVLSRARGHYAL